MIEKQMSTNLMEASREWASRPADQRFQTLPELKAAVHTRRCRSRAVDLDITSIKVASGERGLVINSAISECRPSHWSFGQLATSVGAPASYLRKLPDNLVVDCLSHGLTHAPRESVKFMTVAPEEDGPATLQAVTSTTYGRIWDADVADAVSRLVDRTGNRFYNPKDYRGTPGGLYASDHDIFVFMIDGGSVMDAGPRAQLNRGFIVWNSETGARTFGLMTFLFNHVCGNHIIWGATDINKLVIRHTSGGPYRFDAQAAPALKAYVDASEAPMISAVRKAQAMLLPDKREELVVWVKKHGKFTGGEISEAVNFAKSEEGECRTLWQLVQGFTAYARGFEYVDTRVDLEKRAGALLELVSGN